MFEIKKEKWLEVYINVQRNEVSVQERERLETEGRGSRDRENPL